MKFFQEKRRMGIVAVLTALLGAAALMIGAGGASAAHCNTMPSDPGNVNFEAPPVGEFGVDHDNAGTTTHGAYWCVWTPQAGGHHVAGSFHLQDASTGTLGGQFDLSPACPDWTCPAAVQRTGAEVGTPSTSLTTAGSRPGGAVGTGTGTCTYVNGAPPTCPAGLTVAGITVNVADLTPAVSPSTPTPPCTGINNTCIPLGATVRVFQDTLNPTLTVRTAATPATNLDVAPTGTCVQVNATC